jgi:hypothetical protein
MSQSRVWDTLQLARDARSPETHGSDAVAALMREVDDEAPPYVRCTYRRTCRATASRVFHGPQWSEVFSFDGRLYSRRLAWAGYVLTFSLPKWMESNQNQRQEAKPCDFGTSGATQGWVTMSAQEILSEIGSLLPPDKLP